MVEGCTNSVAQGLSPNVPAEIVISPVIARSCCHSDESCAARLPKFSVPSSAEFPAVLDEIRNELVDPLVAAVAHKCLP
jgi:hypothetical protein